MARRLLLPAIAVASLAAAVAAGTATSAAAAAVEQATVTGTIGDRVQANFFAAIDMPLRLTAAVDGGWARVGGSGAACSPLYGHRYRRGTRLSPTMLYDHTGQVAGVQFAFNASQFPLYPGSSLKVPQVFRSRDETGGATDIYVVTAHFSDPARLCEGAQPRAAGSVGDRVWVRESEVGSSAEHFYPLPLTRDQIKATDGWVPSGCMVSGNLPMTGMGMGQHYWRQAWPHMRSTDFYPFFLLFDQNNNLNMFGASISGPIPAWPTHSGQMDAKWAESPVPCGGARKLCYPAANNSELWTYPQQPLLPFFHFHEVMPMNSLYMNTQDETKPGGTFATSTMHIILRDSDMVTDAACAPHDTADPLNQLGQTAEGIRAAYNATAPAPKGGYSLDQACKAEVALAQGAFAPDAHRPDPDANGRVITAAAVGAVAGLVVGAAVMALYRARVGARGRRRRSTMIDMTATAGVSDYDPLAGRARGYSG